MLGGALAPDANWTLRITYGTVKSLKPQSKDAADWPFTTASQILAKDTGKEPFDAPAKLLEAIKAKKFGPYADPALGGELPIDFLERPRHHRRQLGLADAQRQGRARRPRVRRQRRRASRPTSCSTATTTRTIHVDARYMMWTMDLLDGADHLVKEMGLEPKLQ